VRLSLPSWTLLIAGTRAAYRLAKKSMATACTS